MSEKKIYCMNTNIWTVERAMFIFGGILTIIFSLLALFVHPKFSYATIFVGSMFIIFATTGYCPAAILAAKLMKK